MCIIPAILVLVIIFIILLKIGTSHQWGNSFHDIHGLNIIKSIWDNGQDASWTSPWGGVSGMPMWEETPGQDVGVVGVPENKKKKCIIPNVSFLC